MRLPSDAIFCPSFVETEKDQLRDRDGRIEFRNQLLFGPEIRIVADQRPDVGIWHER